MLKSIIALGALLVYEQALAGGYCFQSDRKNELCHLAGGAISAVVANEFLPRDPLLAFGLAMTPGVLKEIHDRRRGGHVSGRDLALDAVGAGLTLVVLKVGDGTIRFTPRSIALHMPIGK